jgi:hypothetical protein
MTQQQAVPEEGGGVSGALTRPIGPLKAWQWGLVVGGGVLLYYVISGRGSSSGSTTTATVPFTNVGDTIPTTPAATTPVVDNTVKTLLGYQAGIIKAVGIYDVNGKKVGTLAAGKNILVGTGVRQNGRWYYPILSMPGKFLTTGSGLKYTAIYNTDFPNPVKAATTAVAAAVAEPATLMSLAPVTTSESNPTKVAATSADAAGVAINHGISITPVIVDPPSTVR